MRFALLTPLLAALAWPAHATNRTDPADPKTPVPALQHRSVLARPAAPVTDPAEPGRWRAAHEAVHRAGGWRAYAREPVPAAPDASAPMPPKHHQHGAPQ